MRKVIFGLMVVGLLLVGANVFAAGDLIVNGKIGVGTTTPVTSLDVNGGIKVGNVTAACSASLNGVLRYSGTALEFCNGTSWQMLSSVIPPNPDPNIKLLLHMDGTNGSTAFTDGSLSAHSVTANGNAQISTSQSKFGGASGLFDGSGDYISVPASSDFNFGSGDFTIDFWIYPTSATQKGSFFYQGTNSDNLTVAIFTNFPNSRSISIYASSNGISWDMIIGNPGGNGVGAANTLTLNSWNHVAYVRNGNTWKTFINGIQDLSLTVSGTVYSSNQELKIGYLRPGDLCYFVGAIDEFRVSKGIARWTSNFTPPTAPY